ncbi:shikimate dehydrogenase [Pseudokineococcus basanitobsidens]|uniref:Shikimate dehydrogenase n=1 Tax=Pseudokineococcus basanitobsidens TaxID=1926649 RepID=A0ABU8RHZ4_9ACTN
MAARQPAGLSADAAPDGGPLHGRRAAVLGSPVAHSLSPAMHRAAHAALGLQGWTYEAVEVDEAGLPAFLEGCGAAWAGLSLTMPLKRAVLPLLAHRDDVAAATGAVNTVTWVRHATHDVGRAGREPVGANTDVEGVVRALGPVLTPAPAGGRRGVVLGGGATAVSSVVALGRLGCPQVVAHVREPARAGALVAAGQRSGVEVELAPWAEAAAGLVAADVVVSTAPAGAADDVARSLARATATGAALLDVVYDPWPTALARAWAGRGPVVDGVEMLVHQAVAQVALMTGHRPAADVLRHAAARERRHRATSGG